jgi:hypothetical protein
VSYLFHHDLNSVADDGDEHALQVRLRGRMRIVAPGVKLVAASNGAKMSAWSALQMKAEGMSKGYPDLVALWSNGSGENAVPGIAYLELKKRGGSLRPEQIYWLNWLHNAGFPCGCFRSVETAVEFLRRAGAPIMAVAA